MSVPLQISQEEAANWQAHLSSIDRKATRAKRKVSQEHQKRIKSAVELYIKTRSKSYVCNKKHMSRRTLNKYLKAAGVA